MPLKRIVDWPSKLTAFIISRQRSAFNWGTNDCATFVADGILEMTGVDLAHDLRGKYSDEDGARRLLMEKFSGWIEDCGAAIFQGNSIPEINPKSAQRGDAVLAHLDAAHGDVMALVGLDGRFVLAPGPEGLMQLPINRAKRAWKVGL